MICRTLFPILCFAVAVWGCAAETAPGPADATEEAVAQPASSGAEVDEEVTRSTRPSLHVAPAISVERSLEPPEHATFGFPQPWIPVRSDGTPR